MRWLANLTARVENYDRFLEHRTNGLKAVFVLEILFCFNFIYTVPNPYFYYFYVPLTAFTAELAGRDIREKFILFIVTMLGSILCIFLFGVFSAATTFFVCFVFLFTLMVYISSIRKFKALFVSAPIMLSLAAYSLIYGNNNTNFYLALNHALQSLLATALISIGLLFFPKIYYFASWRRGFCNVVSELEQMTAVLARGENLTVTVISGTLIMDRFAQMLSRKIKYYSVLKINLLSLDLVMSISYFATFQHHIKLPDMALLHHYLQILNQACQERLPVKIPANEWPNTRQLGDDSYELQLIYQLMKSWNNLCLHA